MHSKYDEIQEILDNFKAQLKKNRSDFPTEASEKEDWPLQVKRAVTFIYKHLYNDRLTVSWMKDKCQINDKSFAARFHQYIGLYPKEYILYLRIRTAKKLLKKRMPQQQKLH